MKKIVCLLLLVCMAVCAFASCSCSANPPSNSGNGDSNESPTYATDEEKYQAALLAIEEKRYASAKSLFIELGDYKDSAKYLADFYIVPKSAEYIYSTLVDGGDELIEKGSQSLSFNEKGLPKTLTHYANDIIISSESYFYDENNILIKTTGYELRSEKFVYSYEYDAKGRVIRNEWITYEFVSDGVYTPNEREVDEFTYDSNGEVIGLSYKRYSYNENGEDVLCHTSALSSKFDEKGNKISASYKEETYEDGALTYECVTECEYNYDYYGMLSTARKRRYENEKLCYDYFYSYSCYENGDIKVATFTDENSDRDAKVVTEFEYDDFGNVIKQTQTHYSLNGNLYVAYRKNVIERTFDENGNLVKETDSDYNLIGDKECCINKGVSEYNSQGEEIYELRLWYSYDEEGNLISAIGESETQSTDINGFIYFVEENEINIDESGKENFTVVSSGSVVLDSLGRVVEMSSYDENAVLDKYTKISYNNDGKIAGYCDEYYSEGELEDKEDIRFEYTVVYYPFEIGVQLKNVLEELDISITKIGESDPYNGDFIVPNPRKW